VTLLAALQNALAAEHATVYGYGVVGAHLRGSSRQYALDALDAHLEQRDRLIASVTALGATPVAALPAYQLPFPVETAGSAEDLAATLEQGSASATWALIAASAPDSPTRRVAIGWLSEAALRAAYWGGAEAMPGRPPLA
jgi:Domain of unknown function (DUF4439)